jgi:hypothetical protein
VIGSPSLSLITIYVRLSRVCFFYMHIVWAVGSTRYPKLRFDSTVLHTHHVSIYRQASVLLAEARTYLQDRYREDMAFTSHDDLGWIFAYLVC